MTSTRILIVLVACSVGALGLRAEEKPAKDVKPDATKILARIDAALFFPDSQAGLKSYTCSASVTTSSTSTAGGAMIPDASKAKFLAKVAVDCAKGTRIWKDAQAKVIPAGAWAPGCGPWTLTNVMQVETELFLSPLSPRFPETAWKREGRETPKGWRLVLTPKSSSVNAAPSDFLTPSLTRLEIFVGRDGVPTHGILGLKLGSMEDNGEMKFEFVDIGEKKRIEVIRSTVTSANLTIRPKIRFHFKKQGGFLLPTQVVFEVPPGDLSPSLGGMMGGMSMPSALLFTKYKVKKARRR
jgi:hypothetical protein